MQYIVSFKILKIVNNMLKFKFIKKYFLQLDLSAGNRF